VRGNGTLEAQQVLKNNAAPHATATTNGFIAVPRMAESQMKAMFNL
jgi:hypothetical protein